MGYLRNTSSSVEMAHRLNIKCVAEGVETQAEWNILMSMHCDTAQGLFIAEPMDKYSFLEYAQH